MEDRKTTFFKVIFGGHAGYACIAKRQPGTRTFDEVFFQYPAEVDRMGEYCNTFGTTQDVYYCPQLFDAKKRTKEHVSVCPTVWADLDTCSPEALLVEPSITIESSPARYQALWLLEGNVDIPVAEDISRRIAYYHSEDGADKTGWDLTQLLRVPGTNNHKYQNLPAVPTVRIIKTKKGSYKLTDFDVYPEAEGFEYTEIPMPQSFPDRDEVLQQHKDMAPQVWTLLSETPKKDWSKALWQLEMLLAEAGLTREEMYTVAKGAPCNKYERDGRSDTMLWRDVCKAFEKHYINSKQLATGPVVDEALKPLLTEDEIKEAEANPGLVEEYIEWAKTLGDAAWQYHQAGAFVILSSLLAGTVRLPTSYGLVTPNVWFMILADTTLTRKTTAMDLAMDLIVEVDSDAVLATDGSLEGLMTSLSMRPGRPSIFLRDEFSGLLESMTKKDYYAGMAETLTKLYDGKFQKRVLRKEVLEVRDPCLIIFAGGIRSRIMELLTPEHIASGFMPRFIMIAAESDISRLRPLGPPTEKSQAGRQQMIAKMTKLYQFYNRDDIIKIEDKAVVVPRRWEATLTPAAWSRYNEMESTLLDQGLRSAHADLITPTFDRMAKSGLKLAVLLAALRMDEHVVVTEQDITRAFYYIERWRPYTMEMIKNIGKSANEKIIERVYNAISKQPQVLRSHLMQAYHLNARDTEAILQTLEQRGLVTRLRSGRQETLSIVEGASRG